MHPGCPKTTTNQQIDSLRIGMKVDSKSYLPFDGRSRMSPPDEVLLYRKNTKVITKNRGMRNTRDHTI